MNEGGVSIEEADVQNPQPVVECKPEPKNLSWKQKALQLFGIGAVAAATGIGGVACSDTNNKELNTKPYNDATAAAAIKTRNDLTEEIKQKGKENSDQSNDFLKQMAASDIAAKQGQIDKINAEIDALHKATPPAK